MKNIETSQSESPLVPPSQPPPPIPEQPKRNWVRIALFGIFGIAILSSTIFAGYQFRSSKTTPTPAPQTFQAQPTTTPTPSPTDETANWKTYTNIKRDYAFQYPTSYVLKETQASSTSFEAVNLEKDTEYQAGGFGGGTVLKKGVVISIIFKQKDLSEATLKSEFGSDINLKKVFIGQKEATEIVFPGTGSLKQIFLQRADGVLDISADTGFASTSQESQIYLSEFNQILSTFRFINSP